MSLTGDFDEDAIEFYKSYYNCHEERLFQEKNDFIFCHCGKRISVRGDVCFNLKKEYRKNYCTLFSSIIKDDENFEEQNFEELYKQLGELAYSPMNISIMPRTGELNNTKKSIGDDRFDTFAWLLDLYYDKENGSRVPIINAGTKISYIGNRKVLGEFLDSYEGVKDYFADFYGLEEEFVERLVKSGRKTITDRHDLFEYIKLAVSFWKIRMDQKRIKKFISIDEEKYRRAIELLTD